MQPYAHGEVIISVRYNALDQFEEVDAAYKKLGKKAMSQKVFELCKKINAGG